MSKRGQGEGSIYKRADGRWEAIITLPGGKRKSFYAKSRQEAARQLAAATRDRDNGLLVAGERQTLTQYLRGWLEMARSTVRPQSWLRYEEIVRLHIVPTLGGVMLSRLTAQQVQSLYAAKLAEGLSPTTVKYIHVTIHRALREAQRLDLVQRNVATLVSPPRPRRPEMHILTPDQARRFLKVVEGDRLEALYVLALTTGMRQGELLGLHWRDVDLEQHQLRIRYSLRHRKEGFTFSEPKTARSRRQIALTSTAVTALISHRKRQEQEKQVAGPGWADMDLVFCREDGTPMDGVQVLRLRFSRLLDTAGLPSIRFHDLRHTAATIFFLRGIHPKVVSEMLGRSRSGKGGIEELASKDRPEGVQ
jgi:integrase